MPPPIPEEGSPAPLTGRARRLSETVYLHIKNSILAGDYAPGDWLPIDDLCRLFEVSRQPVMEAMRRLSGEWLVEIIPQVGCRVTQYDRQAMQDFLAIDGEMQGQIAALAAERRTEEQLAKLFGVLDGMSRSTSLDEENRALAREYYCTVLAMAHSPVLAQLCEQTWDFGYFVWSTLRDAEATAKELHRQYDTMKRLAEAIRVQTPGPARLHMVVWLTDVLAPMARLEEEEADPPALPAGQRRPGRKRDGSLSRASADILP